MVKHAHLLKHPKLPKPDFSPLHGVLGDLMPQLMPGPRGRQRLVLALAQRFGENFRLNKLAQTALKHFDGETERVKSFLITQGVQHHD